MYGADWALIGEATSTSTSTKGDVPAAEKGPKTILKVYALNAASAILFALPEDSMKSDAINPVVSQIFG